MVVPSIPFMMNEITLKASLAYDDRHFKETVDAFVAGRSYHRTCKREREKRRERSGRVCALYTCMDQGGARRGAVAAQRIA